MARDCDGCWMRWDWERGLKDWEWEGRGMGMGRYQIAEIGM